MAIGGDMREDVKWELPGDDASPRGGPENSYGAARRWRVPIAGLVVCAGVAVWFLVRPLSRDGAGPLQTSEPVSTNVRQEEPARTVAVSAFEADSSPGLTDASPLRQVELLKREAETTASDFVKAFPNDPYSHDLMAGMHWLFGDPASAEECWNKCLTLEPQFLPAYFGIADVATTGERYEEIVDLMRRALRVHPASARAREKLAEALIELGRFEEAVLELKQPAADSDGSWTVQFMIGKAYLQLEQYEQASKHYEAAMRLDPANPLAYHGMVMVSRKLRNREQTKVWLERFIERRDQVAGSLKVNASADDTPRVRQYVAGIHVAAGNSLVRRGLTGEAENHWLRAATLDPLDLDSRGALHALYERQGRPREVNQILAQISRIQSIFSQHP